MCVGGGGWGDWSGVKGWGDWSGVTGWGVGWGHVIEDAMVTQNRVSRLNSRQPFSRLEITVF